MRMRQLILLLAISYFFSANAQTPESIQVQDIPPTLSGKVKISIIEGTIECDLTLSNIPPISDYLIRLNSGMNLLYIKSLSPNEFMLMEDRSHNDTMSSGESIAYYFADNTGKGKFLPDKLQFKYVGKFPVVTDTVENYSRADWRGNIAFNGYSIRAEGIQGAWYPYLYDASSDKTYECMPYNIEIECIDCSTLYVNGAKPVHAQKNTFKSEVPYELSIYCGNYEVFDDENLVLLNPTFSNKDILHFSSLIAQQKRYYEEHLHIKFAEPPIFVNSTPTSPKFGWLFVSYPTIMGIGYGNLGLSALFDSTTENWYTQFIAHELGHYYFGTYKQFNSELGNMISEGFAEYLSLKLMKDLSKPSEYDQLLDDKFGVMKSFETIPIFKIHKLTDIQNRERFVYNYAPMMLIAIEHEIGIQKMWEWMTLILNSSVKRTDYNFLLTTLNQVVSDEKIMSRIVKNYFTSEKSWQNIKKTLAKKK